jgi:ArsR family transcriptional regulator
MITSKPGYLLGRLSDLSDPTRGRILLALEGHELGVSELQSILQLPQSTVSRHLRILSDGGWATSRSEGPSQRYRFVSQQLGDGQLRLWELVRQDLSGSRAATRDRERVRAVLARRHLRSRQFFATEPARWDHLREELFGPGYETQIAFGLLERDWVVGDLGCGSGAVAARLAPFVTKVIAVDESAAMLDAARLRLADQRNVECRQGELELLPIGEAELDLAVMALVLPHVPEPGRVLGEAARALQAGGRLVVLDLAPHERSEYGQTMGHLWPGFAPGQVQEWFSSAGLVEPRTVSLPHDPSARGPGLFLATARKPTLA